MDLLSEDKLIWSAIIANSRMNRKRQASGVNSYEKEFKFKPEEYLVSKIQKFGHTSWLDLCCGEGNALIQTANYFNGKGLQHKIKLKGVDLLSLFKPISPNLVGVALESGSVVNYKISEKFDLITCCHGIHYLGDKLQVIENSINNLNSEGLFIANLDLRNIEIKGESSDFIKKQFRNFGIEYNSRTRIMKKFGPAEVTFELDYLGANDTAGPNYSGQDAVNSFYSKK